MLQQMYQFDSGPSLQLWPAHFLLGKYPLFFILGTSIIKKKSYLGIRCTLTRLLAITNHLETCCLRPWSWGQTPAPSHSCSDSTEANRSDVTVCGPVIRIRPQGQGPSWTVTWVCCWLKGLCRNLFPLPFYWFIFYFFKGTNAGPNPGNTQRCQVSHSTEQKRGEKASVSRIKVPGPHTHPAHSSGVSSRHAARISPPAINDSNWEALHKSRSWQGRHSDPAKGKCWEQPWLQGGGRLPPSRDGTGGGHKAALPTCSVVAKTRQA